MSEDQRITDEINRDPIEVERLRKARRDAREGRRSPRRAEPKEDYEGVTDEQDGHPWPKGLLSAVIDEALERAQRDDTALKDALSRLSPFEMHAVVHGVADVVRRTGGRC